MSKGAVSQVIQRAIGDAAFRRQLQSDPTKALAGFDLTKDERSAITSGDTSRLTALGVDQRMSKAFGLGALDASKTVISPELSGASATTLIDEGAAASAATQANMRRIEGDLNVAAATVTDSPSAATQANMRRLEGDLNTGAATTGVTVSPSAATQANMRRIEGDLNTGAATAFEPVDLAGSANQLDPGFVTNDAAAIDTADTSAAADALSTPPSGPTTVSADGHAITE